MRKLWLKLNALRVKMLNEREPAWKINLVSWFCVRIWRDSYAR